jgi:chromosome partitioning protein
MKCAAILKIWSSTLYIHRNSKLSDAPSVGKPVVLYDADCKGSVNYLNLAKEVLQKNDMTKMKMKKRF